MKQKRKVLSVAIAAALLSVSTLTGQPKKITPVREFMRQKLEHSKNVLEGLSTGDFDLIGKNAAKLRAMTEESGWQVEDNPEYGWYRNLFRRNVDSLVKSAADRNLDGATLAYVNVTVSCVECHKFVRGKQSALLDTINFLPKSPLATASYKQK